MQQEIERLQTSFTEDLASDAVDSDIADQLAMQSSLAVLAERLATIHMKASGKQQLLEVDCLTLLSVVSSCLLIEIIFTLPVYFAQERVSDRLEGQRQERAMRLCHAKADELDEWFTRMHSSITSILEPKPLEDIDMEDQLAECQVGTPSAVHSEQLMKYTHLKYDRIN